MAANSRRNTPRIHTAADRLFRLQFITTKVKRAANFLRLRKNKLFWGLLAFSAGFGALVAFNYYEMSQIEPITLDGAFFIYPMTACILTAVFIPLFLGREYSDSTIRNKVSAGCSR